MSQIEHAFTNQPVHSSFLQRHLGNDRTNQQAMLASLGQTDLQQWIQQLLPQELQSQQPIELPHLPPLQGLSEQEMLQRLTTLMQQNHVHRFLIGQGYAATYLPAVIQRCVLEDPGWYTAYTPYQAEISQGRLELLLHFQTLCCELTHLPLANASMLDEATAAAEALQMTLQHRPPSKCHWSIEQGVHPQTQAVVATRAKALGVPYSLFSFADEQSLAKGTTGILLQTPDTRGHIYDNPTLQSWVEQCHHQQQQVVIASDPMALCLFDPPGDIGVDIVIGSSQRFGLPLWGGGPHAAYLACQERYKRLLPGRLIGVSKDRFGQPAFRMTLQTREQHIRREKATSNICTAQALLAMTATLYAIYHGRVGLQRIARHIYQCAHHLGARLEQAGWRCATSRYFDTVRLLGEKSILEQAYQTCKDAGLIVRTAHTDWLSITCDERSTFAECDQLVDLLAPLAPTQPKGNTQEIQPDVHADVFRQDNWLNQPVFHQYRTEQQLTRWLQQLKQKDTSLIHSMIPLGSCTMKLNSATSLLPITWESIAQMHPYAPAEASQGTTAMAQQLCDWLAALTHLPAVSLQPNAGSQGEFAGLLVIKQALESRGEHQRKVCLIPTSAHGTNPASAKMAGFEVVPVPCDPLGNISVADLQVLLQHHSQRIGALMITYPSTHGIFEPHLRHICHLVHQAGGLIYLDGANMNAQIGLLQPGSYGVDVMHLNLHKTFSIPHGGGGPGVGPICAIKELEPFLPQDPQGGLQAHAIAAAPLGSAGILCIAWAYIAMMGNQGLALATQHAILNANYMAKRLSPCYPILFQDAQGWVGHECILDIRPIQQRTGIDAEDIAKRLMDYGFHAPTLAFPVPGTLMIEPTESESKAEIDRYCDALLHIYQDIVRIEQGELNQENNPIRGAPHPLHVFVQDDWPYPYSKAHAGRPLDWVLQRKCWPSVGRIDNVYGDRNVHCTCDPVVFQGQGGS